MSQKQQVNTNSSEFSDMVNNPAAPQQIDGMKQKMKNVLRQSTSSPVPAGEASGKKHRQKSQTTQPQLQSETPMWMDDQQPVHLILYQGMKTFCRYSPLDLDVTILLHTAYSCIEVIAYNLEDEIESSNRIYLDSQVILSQLTSEEIEQKKAQEKEVRSRHSPVKYHRHSISAAVNSPIKPLDMIAEDPTLDRQIMIEIEKQFLIQFVLQRLNVSLSFQQEKQLFDIFLDRFPTDLLNEKTGKLKALISPPSYLLPYEIDHHARKAALSWVIQKRKSLITNSPSSSTPPTIKATSSPSNSSILSSSTPHEKRRSSLFPPLIQAFSSFYKKSDTSNKYSKNKLDGNGEDETMAITGERNLRSSYIRDRSHLIREPINDNRASVTKRSSLTEAIAQARKALFQEDGALKPSTGSAKVIPVT